jgi:hypothetical protein
MMDRDQTDFDFAVHFDFAVQEIECCLGLSTGAAQARLRELCASGLVRSWWARAPLMGPPSPIRPSEWKIEEVDLSTIFRGDVVVSKTDLEQQIAGQKDSPRNAEIVKQWRKGLKPGENIPWKKFSEIIRKQCDARPGDRGFSDETIENVTRKLRNLGQIG